MIVEEKTVLFAGPCDSLDEAKKYITDHALTNEHVAIKRTEYSVFVVAKKQIDLI